MVANRMVSGIAAGMAAGALWGFVFLAPQLAPSFTPLELSIGRYLAYGVVAAVLVAPAWRRLLRTLSGEQWRGLAWLGAIGNILYYKLLASAVQHGGVAMTSLVIGLLPVTVTLAGSSDQHAVPLRRLLPCLALSGAGLACVSWPAWSAGSHGSLFGLLCAVGALLSWTWYAVSNSRWLTRLRTVTPHEWNLLTGVVTGAEALALAMPAAVSPGAPHSPAEWLCFAAVASALAVLCSLLGNGLWNHASRVLPLAMTGQMIVFESMFALLYGFAWEQRWPRPLECAAMALMLAGVGWCAAVHRPPDIA